MSMSKLLLIALSVFIASCAIPKRYEVTDDVAPKNGREYCQKVVNFGEKVFNGNVTAGIVSGIVGVGLVTLGGIKGSSNGTFLDRGGGVMLGNGGAIAMVLSTYWLTRASAATELEGSANAALKFEDKAAETACFDAFSAWAGSRKAALDGLGASLQKKVEEQRAAVDKAREEQETAKKQLDATPADPATQLKKTEADKKVEIEKAKLDALKDLQKTEPK